MIAPSTKELQEVKDAGKKPTIAVVTPSVRSFPWKYFDAIKDADLHIVIDDSNGKAVREPPPAVWNGIFIDDNFQYKYLRGAQQTLIPKRNPSCKDFGLLFAWKEGYDIIVLLDDDVDTRQNNLYLDQIPIGKEVQAIGYVSPSGWFNTMQLLTGPPSREKPTIYARGYPYEYRMETITYDRDLRWVKPKFNAGLWVGTPDINGIDKLEMAPGYAVIKDPVQGTPVDAPMPWYIKPEWIDELPQPSLVLINEKQHLPLSIMNVQLHRDLVPAFWQPPDYSLYNTFKVRRHDDVWSMYFLKAVMDMMGDQVTVGQPMIWHRKAGDAVKETLSEHTTNLIQPWLTRVIDGASNYLYSASGSYAHFAFELATAMRKEIVRQNVPARFAQIIDLYAQGAATWAKWFMENS